MAGIFTEDAGKDEPTEVELLKAALLFYSNENYYYDDDIASDGTVHKFSSIEEDAGRLARETLAQCAKK